MDNGGGVEMLREISNIIIPDDMQSSNNTVALDNIIIGTTNERRCSHSQSENISMVTDPRKLMLLNAKRLREKVIVYEYMCYRTSSFYTRLNKILLYPSICLSSLIALLNSNLGSTQLDTSSLQIVNVMGNSLLTFVLTMKSTLKHAERADYFFNLKKKFTSLHNKLNAELIDREISEEDLQMYMKEYDNLDENIVYQFPDRIIQSVKEKFIGCSLPTICNGIESHSHGNSKKLSIPEIV